MRDEQRRALLQAVLKVVAVAVVAGVVIGLGALVLVKGLGLNSAPAAHSSAPAAASPSALPTVALSSPGPTGQATPTASPSSTPPTPAPKKKKAIQLSASPASVHAMQRVNLTGTWPGHDKVALQVQSKQTGAWTDFAGVQAQVSGGTFTTYVQTGRAGENRFRVRDPASGAVSKAVTVTVG